MIQKETGWTDDYILWGISWTNLQLKLADAPRYRSGKRSCTLKDEKELNSFLEKYG
jgi:hypothetical protein